MRRYLLPTLIVAAVLVVPLHSVNAQTSNSQRPAVPPVANMGLQSASNSASRSGAPVRDKMEEKRADVLERKETIMENLQSRMAKVSTRAAALKNRLAAFKDKNKAEVSQRVSDRLNMINEKRSEHFLARLENMSKILEKVEKKASESASNAKDVADVTEAIATSKGKIASATALVNDQMNKDYTLVVASESGVRSDAKKMRDMLKNDLTSVRNTVVDTRKTVTDAIMALAKILGAGGASTEATPSAEGGDSGE